MISDIKFGRHLKLSVRGASHARAIRFSLENFPKGFAVDGEALKAFMERRAPGRDALSTARREADEIEFVSGVAEDVTTGEAIRGEIANRDMRPGDYGSERTVPRPGHADFGQWVEMGVIPTGGGSNSGRMTAALCAAGGLCKQWLAQRGIKVSAKVASIGNVDADLEQTVDAASEPTVDAVSEPTVDAVSEPTVDAASRRVHERLMVSDSFAGRRRGETPRLQGSASDGVDSTPRLQGRGSDGVDFVVEAAKKAGDSVGGTISASVEGLPPGIGGALFDGLESELSAALFAVPGVKGVEFGEGFACTKMRGSDFNDPFVVCNGEVVAPTNRQGGILGGRTSGMPVTFRVALRPTPTVFKEQRSVDLATMKPATLSMKGRHDPCIVRRAVPVVEAVAAFVMADILLADEAAHPRICLTLTGKTLEEDLEQCRSQRYFTDMVELRVDLLAPSERARAAAFPQMLRNAGCRPRTVPVIFTFRRKCDGGAFTGKESARRAFFKALFQRLSDAAGAPRPRTLPFRGVVYVDFEDDFRDEALDALAHKAGVRVVRSLHKFDGPVRNVSAVARRLVKGTDEIAKIAFMPKTLADVSRLFRETADFTDVPHVVCAMGPMGVASRVLAGRTHSLWTYASVGGLNDLGHVSPHELVRTYRFRTVTREAALFGVTGFPLKATRSPEINNAAWAREDVDAVMVPFPATTAREALGFMKAMKMRGMAVTIPHKQKIMPLLDRITPFAKRVGAVNTVSFEKGKYVGYNTDVQGFAEALKAFVGESVDAASRRVNERSVVFDTKAGGRRGETPRLQCALLGDGGAAQAVKVALRELGIEFEVFHRRTPGSGGSSHTTRRDAASTGNFDLFVNATPVDPIPDYEFTGRELVYDLGYVPAETPLMARARKAGCRVENGFTMLQAQAREQRRVWRIPN